MALPPHPLPSRPSTTQPVPPRPPPPQAARPPAHPRPGVPLSLPSRPSFLPTPPVAAAHSANSLAAHPPPSASSPRLSAPGTFPPASSAPSPHLRTPLPSAAASAGGPAAPLPWPTPLDAGQATTTAQLIELGEGWVVRYRAWKAPARCLDPPLPPDADLLAWDPLAPTCASSSSSSSAAAAHKLASSTASSKGDDVVGPPSKKAKKGGPARVGNAFDELLAEELGSSTPALGGQPSPSLGTPLASPSLLGPATAPPPPSRLPSALRAAATTSSAAASSASSSTAAHGTADAGPSPASPAHGGASPDSDSSPSCRLRARLSALRAAAPSDPLALAQAHLAQRMALARDEGRDRLALLSWVGSATVRVGGRAAPGAAKGKAKAREGDEPTPPPKRERSEEREADGGSEGEGRALWVFGVVRGGEADGEGVKLDELAFEGLEPFASGEFTHASLFPALYPTAKAATSPAYASPLSLPAHAYPSALAISDALVSIPLIAQPPPSQTPVQAAYESFRTAISSILLDELAQQPVPSMRCVRLGASVVFVPLATPTSSSASSTRFAPLSPRPALELSLAPLALNRSSIHLQSRLAHLNLAPLPLHLDLGARVRLAPLDARGTFLRVLRVSAARRAQLDAEWAPHVAGACGSVVEHERTQYVLCALEPPGGTAAATGDRVEVVWPRALVLLDGEREQAPMPVRDDDVKGAPSEPSPARPPAAPSAEVVAAPAAPSPQPSRALRGAPLRARLAGQLLLRGRTSRGRGSEGSSAGDVGELGAFRSPVKRRTGDVWRWIGDEGRRREEEKENAARREAEKDRELAEAPAPEPAVSAAGKDDDKLAASGHAPAAAPINMRTPMSLGASSTEAPSPAELFSSSLHPMHAGPHLPPPPSSSAGTHDQSHDALHGMDIDFGLGMYPSPAEPAGSHGPAPASTATPMSTLETAFSEFDWGDGTFGTSGMSGGGGGRAGGGGGPSGGRSNDGNGGGYDDGIMLGLTDDDFSFFDAPTPDPGGSALALSMPPPPLAPVAGDLGLSTMPSVSGMDAAFDLFSSSAPSDLPGMTSTVSTFAADPVMASTTSPQFPQGPSPALPFSFDAFDPLTPSALELAASSPGGAALSTMPYSPVVHPSTSATPASLALVPYTPQPASYSPIVVVQASPKVSPGRARALSAFEPVAFDPAQSALDDKYDPRRGKFGLPSPDSDHEGRALVHPAAPSKDRRSWYSAVCDPRIALAERLRRQRLVPSKAAPTSSRFRHDVWSSTAAAPAPPPPPPPQRAWVRRRLGAALGLGRGSFDAGSPSTSQHTADEAESEMSSSDSEKDDAMDVDRSPRAGPDDEPRDAEQDRSLDAAFSSSLLDAASVVKPGAERASVPYILPSQSGAKVDPARDLTYHVVAEHLMHLPDLRDATLAFSRRPRRTSMVIASRALATASTALAAVCSALSPSPLFADHTALASLEQEDAPTFLLRTQQCVVETSCAAVDFWRPMGFEPLPGAKSVTAFVVYEDTGAEVHETVKEWFRAISSTYEGLRLGSHTPGTVSASSNFAGVQDGLVPLPAGLLSTSQQREELKLLYTALSDTSKTSQNTVVYLIAPLADSPLAQGSPLASIIHQVGKSRHGASAVNMLPCTVPMASLTRSAPSTSTTSTAGRLARLAFSVYDQLQIPVERLRFPMPETFPSARPPPLAPLGPAVRLYTAPAINVAPAASSRAVQFSLSWPPMALEVEHRHRLLHVCYTSRRLAEDSEQECLVVATVDEKGESWKVAPRLIKAPIGPLADVQRVRLVWSFVKSLVDAVDVEWRIILCKVGEPTGLEAKTWDSLLKEYLAVVRRPLHVTFTCAELDPALAVLPRHAFPAHSSAVSTPSAEDGQVSVAGSVGSVGDGKSTLFDATPSTLTYTPAEPVSTSILPFTPAASTYFMHIPRLSSHAHSTVDLATSLDPSSTSTYAVHFFLSHASRTSSYKATLGALVGDVRRSFVELAALGQVRWGTSGRLAWHLEATSLALLLAEQLS